VLGALRVKEQSFILVKKRSATGHHVSLTPPSARLPDFVEPMKAKLVESIRPGNWIYEIKFDGYRALALRGGHETRIVSRNEKDLGKKFPIITDSIAGLDVQDAIIDGEIVALDEKGRTSFQMLQGFDMGQERPPIIYYAFDLLRLNGKDLQKLPIEERKSKLEELLKKPAGVLRYSVSFTKDIQELLDRAQKLGLEGLIGKRSGSRYEAGKRSGAWVKIKLHQEQEFVIGGYTDPEGSRKYFGALLVGFYEGKNLKFGGRVGTGFSEKLLRSLSAELRKIGVERCPFFNLPAAGRNRWDQGLTAAEMKRCHWVKPLIVCQVKFTEWTRDDRLRQPVFLGIREDKRASEMVREQDSTANS
jgi:bifunctional non-homologous end joining protein LigD